MKFKIPVPAAMIGMLAGIALFAVTLVLDTSIPGAASGLICGGGGVLVGLCGTALGLAWADRRLTPEERQEIARGGTGRAQHGHPGESRLHQLVLVPISAVGPVGAHPGGPGGYVRGRSRRRHCAPLCVLPGEHEALGQKAVRGYSKC